VVTNFEVDVQLPDDEEVFIFARATVHRLAENHSTPFSTVLFASPGTDTDPTLSHPTLSPTQSPLPESFLGSLAAPKRRSPSLYVIGVFGV
jgi:hypothetical protein